MNLKLRNEQLNRLSIEDFKKADKTRITVILDNIRSLNNIGSVFRTCDAFKIERIVLCGITAKPPHKDIYKTALGSTESVNWQYRKSTIDIVKELKDQDYTIIAIEQTEKSIELNNYFPKQETRYAIILGNEIKGVQQEVIDLSDICIEVPQFGSKHSLNISVCAGIILWDFYHKLFLNNK